MNSELYGRKYPFPGSLRRHLVVCMRQVPDADENVEGFRRNKELQRSKDITYQQLKRMKNWFDGFQGRKEDAPYILNGGDVMKDWIDKTLSSSRRGLETTRDRKGEFIVDTGEITPQKTMTMDLQVTEELKKINELLNNIL